MTDYDGPDDDAQDWYREWNWADGLTPPGKTWTWHRGWVDLPDPDKPHAGFTDEAVRAR